MSYKIVIIEKKDLIKQLEASKRSINNLFSDLLNEAKCFKYQVTPKFMLKNTNEMEKLNLDRLNSTTKTVINHKVSLENASQEILCRIDNWINKGSAWIIELIESQYINISNYRPLSESCYIKLPVELNGPKKGLIKITNNYQ